MCPPEAICTMNCIDILNKDYSPETSFMIKTKCTQCKKGYFKDINGNCEGRVIETCSYLSLLESYPQKYDDCMNFCKKDSFVMINYTMNRTENNNSGENTINNDTDIISINFDYILEHYVNLINLTDEDLKNIIIKGQLCISNSVSKNIRKCKITEYINNEYICKECIDGYSLDNLSKICKQNNQINLISGISNCFYENIGTIDNPIYSCKKCYDNTDIFVYKENGVKICEKPLLELEGCTEVNSNTSYIKSIYNCTECSINYLPYYSQFFKRKICQNIYQEIIRKKELSFDAFSNVDSIPAKYGICENNKLFTPDGINCYACNNKIVGMVGCKGSCTFSLERNNVIECEEDGCKTGYLESSKGICESCNTINNGCFECHQEEEKIGNFIKKKFICDQCEEGFLTSNDKKCHHCSEIGFTHCEKCQKDKDNENELVCVQCSEGYFLTNEGYCSKCNNTQVKTNRNTCVFCDDIDEGGIEGCKSCYNDGERILCKECDEGFILLSINQTCLKITENKELEEFNNCQQLSLNDNGLFCSKCIENYILLKEENSTRCVNYTFIPSRNFNINKLCQESINYGTEEKPIFSCNKCIDNNYIEESEKEKGKVITKFTNIKNNISFCDYSNNYPQLENCIEAEISYSQGINRYNCTKCNLNSILHYNLDIDSNICRYINYEQKCLVKFCKTCQNENNYFCSVCLPSDYEVNKITGSCIKKTEKVPVITWKDIFRLEMNQQKEINGKEIIGPKINLRGITNSQINTGHAFLVYLIFKLKNLRNRRYLEEKIKIPAICEIIESVDETNNDINIVDYDCIGNMTENDNLDEYSLDNIEEGNNDGIIGKSNLEEILSKRDLSNLENKQKSTYTLKNLVETTLFEMDKIQNQTSINYIFDFSISGRINKELDPTTIEGKIELVEIKNKTADCQLNIKEKSKADLNCQLNIEKYKEYKTFSFKVSEIGNDDNRIYLSKINQILLINEGIINVDNKKNEINIIIIVIISIAIIVFVGIIVLIIFCIKKCRSNKEIIIDKNINIIQNRNEIYVTNAYDNINSKTD